MASLREENERIYKYLLGELQARGIDTGQLNSFAQYNYPTREFKNEWYESEKGLKDYIYLLGKYNDFRGDMINRAQDSLLHHLSFKIGSDPLANKLFQRLREDTKMQRSVDRENYIIYGLSSAEAMVQSYIKSEKFLKNKDEMVSGSLVCTSIILINLFYCCICQNVIFLPTKRIQFL